MDHMAVSPRDRDDRPDRIEAVQVRLWNDAQHARLALRQRRHCQHGRGRSEKTATLHRDFPRKRFVWVQQAMGSLHCTRSFGAGGQLFPIFQKEVMKFFVTPVTFDRHTDGCQ